MALTKVTGDGVGTLASATITAATISNQLTDANMPAGSVIQIVQTVLTTSQSTTGTSYADITGFTASITPSDNTNKILIEIDAHFGMLAGNTTRTQLLRGSTVVVKHTTAGVAATEEAIFLTGGFTTVSNRQNHFRHLTFLDNPQSTSELVYKLRWKVDGSTAYLNRWALNSDLGNISTITLKEIVV